MKQIKEPLGWWRLGTRVKKIRGASWQGRVVGYYETDLTNRGYAIESELEIGSVQIYPEAALEMIVDDTSEECRGQH